MKNLFYRLCLWLGYVPTEHLELRIKLLGYKVIVEDNLYYMTNPSRADDIEEVGGNERYWRVRPQLEERDYSFSNKREALKYILRKKGA